MDIAAEKAYPTPYVNSAILPLLLLSLASQRHSPKLSRVVNKEYDYIIVGGGTAGSVVASRLSEIPCVSVLLLEAGKEPPLLTEVPAISKFFRFTDIDWKYKTTPQKNTGEALENKEIPLALGKVLGGSSVLNSAVSFRGSRYDYDEWAARGAYGWSFEEIFPYFQKLEDNQDPEYLGNGFHTKGGLFSIQRPRYQPETKKPIFRAAKTLGFKVIDPNAWKQTGFYDFQSPIRGGQRCSTAKSYLVPAENRTNLHILPNSMVRKVIIQERDAVGVSYDHDGTVQDVYARREVIMAAGAINTAKILMLSGIGPKKELENFEIPVWADLPVGENLQDHCAVPLNYAIDTSIASVLEKLLDPSNVKEFIKTKTGVLASVDFISAVGYVNGKEDNQKNNSISYQLTITEGTSIISKYQYGLKSEIYSEIYGPYENKPYITCLSQSLRPRSRGVVRLSSSNPKDPPLVDPNYMDHPEDVLDIVEGLKKCQTLAATPAMRKLGADRFRTFYPACKQYRKSEDLYLWCLSKQVVISMNNPVGTAKMGDYRDPSTVVDPELRVKYLRRLRVVDASVMPTITSGDTTVPIIMIAEKASDIIKSAINCNDEVDESEVQESMPVISISPEVLRQLPKLVNINVGRKPASNRGLSELKGILSLMKENKLSPRTPSLKKSERRIKELIRQRRQDTSSATLREVLRCLEELNMLTQQQNMQTPSMVYSDGVDTDTALAQLADILNAERQSNAFQTFNRQQGLNSEVSTVLTQLSMLLERLRNERDVSATTNTDSSINQGVLLNQILSAVTGNAPGSQTLSRNPILLGEASNTNPLDIDEILNQIWSTVNDIRQIEDLSQAVRSINNNTNRTENMMSEILTAVNDLRTATSQRETTVSTTTPVPTATPAPTTESPQQQTLNEILSTLNELRRNNRSRPIQNNTADTNRENPNDATLRQIFSAINEMRESLTGVVRNTTSSNVPQRNLTSAEESIRLLQQILEQMNEQPVVGTMTVQEELNVLQPNPVIQANPVVLPGVQPGLNGMPIVQQGVQLGLNGMPIVQPGVQLGLNGMPIVQPGVQLGLNGRPIVQPGVQPGLNGLPIVQPGVQANPLLSVIQRQRNLQLLSAMTGGNLPGMRPPGFPPQVPLQMMGMRPPFLPNQQISRPPLMFNRVPNQDPCQRNVIVNNLNLCNGNDLQRRPMTANEIQLCRSLRQGSECRSRTRCGGVSPILYRYYCVRK